MATITDDIVFNFDAKPFLVAIQQMTAGMTKMTNAISTDTSTISKKSDDTFKTQKENVKNTQENTKKSAEASGGMITGLIGKIGGIAVAYLGVRAAMRAIPEIGQAFSIVGDIINKNLFWPLRKELVPYLQQMMTWVRTHRMMFVEWGRVIANAFRAVVTVVKIVFDVVSKMFSKIASIVEGTFGKTTGSITRLLNVTILKITVLVSFVIALLEPVFDFIANGFGNLITASVKFFRGFVGGADGLARPLRSIYDSMIMLLKMFTSSKEEAKEFGDAMGELGGLLGRTVVVALEGMANALAGIVHLMKSAAMSIRYISEWSSASTPEERKKINKKFELEQDAGRLKLYKQLGQGSGEGSEVPEIEMVGAVPSSGKSITGKAAREKKVTSYNDNRVTNFTITGKEAKGIAKEVGEKLKEQKSIRYNILEDIIKTK
jgi:hypothetical protein